MKEIIELFNRYYFLPTTEHTFTSIFIIALFLILGIAIVFTHLFVSVTIITQFQEEQKVKKNIKSFKIILFQIVFLTSTMFAFNECLDVTKIHIKFKETTFDRQSDQADFIEFKKSLTPTQADKLNKAIFVLYQKVDAETHLTKYSVSDKTELYWDLPEVYHFIKNKRQELEKLD